MGIEKHGGYRSLRLALEEGKLPKASTRLRKAYDCCEAYLRDHFPPNGFNKIQEVYWNTIMGPRILFLLQCNMVTEKGSLHSDWDKISRAVENGLDRLSKMADAPQSAPRKEDWLKVVSRED